MVATNSEGKLLNTGCDISKVEISIREIITSEELFKRWPGVSAQKFAQMVNIGSPKPYVCIREEVESKSAKRFTCRLATFDTKLPPYHRGFEHFNIYTGLVFSIDEVQQIENMMPSLLIASDTPRNEYILANSKTGIDNHFIDCTELEDRWHCDKKLILIIIALQESQFPASAHDESTQTISLDNYYISFHDLLDWESTHNDILTIIKSSLTLRTFRYIDMHHETEESSNITMANSCLNTVDNAHIKPARKTSTENANSAINEKTAKLWEEDLKIAVSLACTLARDCTQRSTKEHIKMWNERHNVSSNKTCRRDAFRAFRRGLPDDLKLENKAKKK